MDSMMMDCPWRYERGEKIGTGFGIDCFWWVMLGGKKKIAPVKMSKVDLSSENPI